MKMKRTAFSKNYLAVLRSHLKQTRASDLDAARVLGLQAAALGLATLDLAKIHEEALIALLLPLDSARIRNRVIRRGVTFFTEAITPIEETHRGAREANVHMKIMIETLTRRTSQLAASNGKLKQEIIQRKIVEDSLRTSELTSSQLLEKSHEMQQELRLLSRRLLSVQEDERKRISRKLHDVVVQTLTGINLRLADLKMQSATDIKDLQKKIATTQLLVEKSVTIVHCFVRDLRPTVLDDLGLIPALRSYLSGFRERSGIPVDFDACAGVEKLDSAGRTVIYRVVQEALSNVSRHAKAKRACVSIGMRDDVVCLEIHDDGKGFPATEEAFEKRAKRLGLLSMRERVEMVGGTFCVESAPGKGTDIQVEIPHGGVRAKISPLKKSRKQPIKCP